MAEKGVMVIEHADFDGTERLAAVLGADILSTFTDSSFGDGSQPRLGYCDLIEEIMIGEDKVIKFSGTAAGEACSIVLRGSGSHILDEAERSLHDAICVLVAAVKSQKVVYGGGNSEIRMSLAVEELAKGVAGKQALAIQSFAQALK
jgi:T-complex protein 1 subunit beta